MAFHIVRKPHARPRSARVLVTARQLANSPTTPRSERRPRLHARELAAQAVGQLDAHPLRRESRAEGRRVRGHRRARALRAPRADLKERRQLSLALGLPPRRKKAACSRLTKPLLFCNILIQFGKNLCVAAWTLESMTRWSSAVALSSRYRCFRLSSTSGSSFARSLVS